MNDADVEVIREWICCYFDKIVKPKITNLDIMIKQGFVEEGLTLTLCYIDAMVNFPYPKRNDRKKTFINVVYDYSNFKESFSKISRIFLVRKGRDPSEKNTRSGTSISCYEKIKEVLLENFGRDNDHTQETDKDGMMKYLKSNLRNCDWENLLDNLDKFSYAGVLYERFRSAGVHEMGIETNLDKGVPMFERNEKGQDIYYSGDILCFSKEIICSTLTNIHTNLKTKCFDEAKWPCELSI